jgi:hypothetical protein
MLGFPYMRKWAPNLASQRICRLTEQFRHNNTGPKFGINLLGTGVRTVRSLTSLGEPDTSQDLLHIPTPWHGCVVEVEGHAQLYMTKAHVVKAAIESQKFQGSWSTSTTNMGDLYRLQEFRANDEPTSPPGTPDSTPSSIYTEKLQVTMQIEQLAAEIDETNSSSIKTKKSMKRHMRSLDWRLRMLFAICFGKT